MERNELRALAADVAAALGDGWGVETEWDGSDPAIRHIDGRRLHIHAPQYPHAMRGKITVSGDYPYRPGAYIEPGNRAEIGISASRGAVVIAREISRRLLPDYTERWLKVLAGNAEHAKSVSNLRAVEARFYAALGKPAPDDSGLPDWRKRERERDTRATIRMYGDGLNGDVELSAYSGDRVSVSLELRSLSVETALELLALLRKLDGAA